MATFTAFNKECSYNILRPTNDPRKSLGNAGQKYKDFRSSINKNWRERVSFGLPLQKVDERNRRSSPLFFHVQALADNQFITVVFHLPASQFHHDKKYQHINFNAVRQFVGELA
ncbi:MAG: hypothetical protein Q9N67_11345 [Ghiorsea sp.]|nr:hypothetical protein [Ghiorsea sp.]